MINVLFFSSIVLCSISYNLAAQAVERPAESTFSFNLKNEPTSFDPNVMNAGESHYVYQNLFRGLIRLDDKGELIFDQAERCQYKTDTLIFCKLRPELKFSDGTPITAKDYVEAFRHFLEPGGRFPHLSIILGIKNARAYFEKKIPAKDLGVTATSPTEIRFELDDADREFLEKLSNPLLTPLKPNGPYRIKEWVKHQKIILEPNPFFKGGNPKRPLVEIYFVSDESTALNLYEKGILKFLWRLPTVNIPKYKDRPDFFQKPVARFDYLGFNLRASSPFANKNLRKAFAKALNFEDFKTLFKSLGAPGCPGLGELLLNPEGHCVEFDSNSKPITISRPLKLYFSQLGGDDIRQSAEWFQGQWQKNLKVRVEIKGLEHKHYIQTLETDPPDIFRLGVAINRPTCLAALEIFKKDAKENYVGFSNMRFENLTNGLKTLKMPRSERESVCGVASDILFKEEYVAIPLGRIHFTMLLSPKFKGVRINDLNQLDLSDLEYVGAK